MKNFVIIFVLLLVAFRLTISEAKTVSSSMSTTTISYEGPIYDSLLNLIDKVKSDVKSLEEVSPKVGLVDMSVSENLAGDVKDFMLKQLEGIETSPTKNTKGFRFVQCKACFSLRAETRDGQVVVKKGLTNNNDVKQMSKELGVEHYADTNLFYTGSKAILTLNIYKVSDNTLVWSRSYSSHFSSTKEGFKFGASMVQVLASEGKPHALDTFFTNRIYGFGDIGVGALVTTTHENYSLYQSFGPTVAMNIHEFFGYEPLGWGNLFINARSGIGFYGGQKDMNLGGGLRVEVGQYYFFDAQYLQRLEVAKNTTGAKAPNSTLLGFGVRF